jgi:hypothetical protein
LDRPQKDTSFQVTQKGKTVCQMETQLYRHWYGFPLLNSEGSITLASCTCISALWCAVMLVCSPCGPTTMAALYEAWTVFALSNTGVSDSNPTVGMGVLSVFILCLCR